MVGFKFLSNNIFQGNLFSCWPACFVDQLMQGLKEMKDSFGQHGRFTLFSTVQSFDAPLKNFLKIKII